MCISIFGCKASNQAINITFLGLVIRRIHFSNVANVTLGSKGIFGEMWTIFKWWGLVTITKKEGWLKYVTVAPDNPEQFLSEVKKHLKEHRK